MSFRLRKLFVGFVSLGAVLAIYLLYSQISQTPQIDIDTAAEFTDSVAESNIGKFGSEIGRIGDVGVGTVQKARYTHLDENKEIDREFGFEKLLHESGDEWDIEKPYMNIFQRNFKCYLTADKGKVRVETAAGKPSPKDGKLTGNVVIHILPENSSSVKESFIYLDDVVFIGEKSQFSTDGPVKFVSEGAQMLGRGLELVYNSELGRLEFLRIIHLESLRLKTSNVGLFSSGQQKPKGFEQRASNHEPQITSHEPRATSYYRCLFSKNVVIDCPEQLVFADEVFINNIFWSRASGEKSSQADTVSADNAKRSEVDESTEEPVDIVITCDNGILVTPMDSARLYGSSAKFGTKTAVTTDKGFKNFGDIHGQKKYTLSAPQLTVDLSEDKTSATGIEHLTASGGVVQLSVVKRAGEELRFAKSTQNANPEKLLGFTKLKALQFDYTLDERLFVATGPGAIAVDNSGATEPNSEAGKFSLRKPCYAVVRNFDTLKYSLEANRIIADNRRQRILIDYFPIVQGQYGQQVTASAGHVEVNLVETADGRIELSTLSATGGIDYEEEDIQFEGSELFYDADKSIMTVRGDELQPCYFNGALVDAIEYNLNTGRVKAKIIGSGALMKR